LSDAAQQVNNSFEENFVDLKVRELNDVSESTRKDE
jgi:hypothetical protein